MVIRRVVLKTDS
jgi:hypothetical protein